MKLGFKMWKASWIILIGFISFFTLDMISTLSAGHLLKYMEINPVFIQFGWFGIIGTNILALYLFLKGYDSTKPHNRFMILTAFVYISVVRFFISINNFKIGSKVQSGEITQAMVEGVSTSTKVAAYSSTIVLNIFAPIIFSLIIYFLFTLDHDIEVEDV